MEQLKLFDDIVYRITYWHYPFNDKGEYIHTRLDLYEEILPEHKLKDMLRCLYITNCVNIKYNPI